MSDIAEYLADNGDRSIEGTEDMSDRSFSGEFCRVYEEYGIEQAKETIRKIICEA